MTPADLLAIQALFHEGFKNAESFNKLYVGIGTLVGVFLGMLVQIYISRASRKSQENIARSQTELQRALLNDQLAMQEAVSKRIARDNISAKRQVWIDELRADIAKYLGCWHRVNRLWIKFIGNDVDKDEFYPELDKVQNEAYELRARIQLRLNPIEFRHVRLMVIMVVIERRAEDFTLIEGPTELEERREKFRRLIDRFVARMQRILKEEWNRIKREEAEPIAVKP